MGAWIGHWDQPSESANDYLDLDDRVNLEGKQDFGQLWVDGHWIGQTLTEALAEPLFPLLIDSFMLFMAFCRNC